MVHYALKKQFAKTNLYKVHHNGAYYKMKTIKETNPFHLGPVYH